MRSLIVGLIFGSILGAILGAGALSLVGPAMAQNIGVANNLAENYTAEDLLSPCTEADNDARWGRTAETECEQFIMGFVVALKTTNNESTCPPELNTPDEVRWAFMRWVHEDYTTHKDMGAGDALLAVLTQKFPCKE